MTKKLLVILLFNLLLAAGLGALIYYAVRLSADTENQLVDDTLPITSADQAVLKAIECMAEKGLFRRSIEIAVSTEGERIRVLFRRPTSTVIAGGGRLPTTDVWQVTFQGKKITMKVLDKKLAEEPFDKEYTKEQDKKFSKAAAAALSYLWKNQTFVEREFAIDVSEEGEGYSVMISSVPYMPGGHRLILLSKELKVSRIHPGV